MVDGGTEGFKGHARVIMPGVTPCFECTIWLFPPQVKFPLCTLAETPRTAAHCIEYAHLIKWDEVHQGKAFDADDPEHMQWVYSEAMKRAELFGITGVTYSLTQAGCCEEYNSCYCFYKCNCFCCLCPGSLKDCNRMQQNIVELSHVIEARLLRSGVRNSGVDEEWDLEAGIQLDELMNLCAAMDDEENRDDGITFAPASPIPSHGECLLHDGQVPTGESLGNCLYPIALHQSARVLYNGLEGLHTKVTEFVRDQDCLVCGPGILIELETSVSLSKFIELLGEHPKLLLSKSSITHQGKNLYMRAPPVLEEMTRSNLQLPLFDLMGKVPKGIVHATGIAENNGKRTSCLRKLRVVFKDVVNGITDMETTSTA
ncbi:hypothetical protein Taro_001279 [Colocasia esculenta]|uniref:NEDD8-activating enzyme E1 catalytic subunit n=1 Tax=Colocasia esculenta TaxID=4460 RepID=A0A843T9F8_COLES|nr:hypothetical protein [Colocasia esculenta]